MPRGASTGFMLASGGVLSEGYGHGRRPKEYSRKMARRKPKEYSRKMARRRPKEYSRKMARRRPKEYRRKVDAATRCSGVCPHT